jgi:RNA polymerase II subunit A small phosphatase-like protein
VLIRPGCREFLEEMAKIYEVVIYTASLSQYADPLMDIIDP